MSPRLSGYADADDGLDFSERAGFLSGKSLALADWRAKKEEKEFQRLVHGLRWRKWFAEVLAENGARLERCLAKIAAYKARGKLALVADYKADPLVCVCRGCGTVWTPVVRGCKYPSRVPEWCPNGTGKATKRHTSNCYQRHHYRTNRRRGTKRCSVCRSAEHTAKQCPTGPATRTADIRRALADGQWRSLAEIAEAVGETSTNRKSVAVVLVNLTKYGVVERRREHYHRPSYRLIAAQPADGRPS